MSSETTGELKLIGRTKEGGGDWFMQVTKESVNSDRYMVAFTLTDGRRIGVKAISEMPEKLQVGKCVVGRRGGASDPIRIYAVECGR